MKSAQTFKRHSEQISNSVSSLVQGKYFFQKYQAFLLAHPNIDGKNQFLCFIGRNYIEAATLGISRQLDHNRKSQSLLNLLRDIDRNSRLFTFRRFSAKHTGFICQTARRDFQQFAIKDGSTIDRRKLRKDIADLKRVTKPVVRYRHKFVGHSNMRRVSIRATMNDLYAAIDLIEKLVIKYDLLIRQSGMNSLRADDAYPNLEGIFKN